ncbi:MAG: response regulator transcription factor [Burkholderiales bacterium]|nr:response regulator transcription factor [Burkholderiales bacterium]
MRILIAEDDPGLAEGIAAYLRPLGHAVEVARHGTDADAMLSGEQYELALIDIGLPRMDGFEVVRRMRARGQTTPAIVITARDALDDRVHGLDLGADDYLVKPFELAELAARIRAVVRRGQTARSARLVHGPLVLDTESHRATLAGEPLDLTAREWAVLEVLLKRVEKVVSKEHILQAISTWEDDLTPNAIEVYVSRLRAKLEPARIRIRTIRGFGYRLEEPPQSGNAPEH